MDNEITIVLAIIGAVTGVSGVILGLINTWHNINDKKIRTKIRFLLNYSALDMELCGYTIEVINLSTFPITIREVGFSLSPFWIKKIERVMITPDSLLSCQLPYRIDSREQANFYFPLNFSGLPDKKIYSVYMKTSCGLYFRGKTPALKSFMKNRHHLN